MIERIDLTKLERKLPDCANCHRPRTAKDVHPQAKNKCRTCTPIQSGPRTKKETRYAKMLLMWIFDYCDRCGDKFHWSAEHMPLIPRDPADRPLLSPRRVAEVYSWETDKVAERFEVVCLKCRTRHEKETGTWRYKVQRSASRRRRDLKGSSGGGARRS